MSPLHNIAEKAGDNTHTCLLYSTQNSSYLNKRCTIFSPSTCNSLKSHIPSPSDLFSNPFQFGAVTLLSETAFYEEMHDFIEKMYLRQFYSCFTS